MSTSVQTKKINVLDLVFTGAIFALFLLVVILSIPLPSTAGKIPLIIGWCGMLFCVVSLVAKRKAKGAAWQDASEVSSPESLSIWKIVFIILVYFAAMTLLGFLISTFAMLILFPIAMKYKKYITLIIFSIITTGLLYFAFAKFFYVRLPSGLLIDLIFKAV